MAESMVITSEMDGSQEFEGMSQEELAAALPRQGEAPKSNATGAQEVGESNQPGAQQERQESAAGGETLEPQAKDSSTALLEKMATIETALQNITRESRAARALQSRLDKLEAALAQRSTGNPQPEASSQEQTPEAVQRAQAEKFIQGIVQDMIHKGSIEAVSKEFGDIIEPVRMQTLRDSIVKRVSDAGLPTEEMNPIIARLLKEDEKAAQAGDQEAHNRIVRVLKNRDPNELILRAVLERSKAVQAKGAQVQKQQAQQAGKGARMVSQSGQRQQTQSDKKRLEDMSEDEINNLDMDELGKLLPKQNSRR